MQQLVDLRFKTLAELDNGRIELLLAYHLQRASQDCQQRPGDKSTRKVTLEFLIKPRIDPDTGDCDEAQAEIECKSKMPTHRSKPYTMLVTNSGFKFNRDFPSDIDQPSLYDGDDS